MSLRIALVEHWSSKSRNDTNSSVARSEKTVLTPSFLIKSPHGDYNEDLKPGDQVSIKEYETLFDNRFRVTITSKDSSAPCVTSFFKGDGSFSLDRNEPDPEDFKEIKYPADFVILPNGKLLWTTVPKSKKASD